MRWIRNCGCSYYFNTTRPTFSSTGSSSWQFRKVRAFRAHCSHIGSLYGWRNYYSLPLDVVFTSSLRYLRVTAAYTVGCWITLLCGQGSLGCELGLRVLLIRSALIRDLLHVQSIVASVLCFPSSHSRNFRSLFSCRVTDLLSLRYPYVRRFLLIRSISQFALWGFYVFYLVLA